MKNFVKEPHKLVWTNSTGFDVDSGDLVDLGAVVGVAHEDIANGDSGVVHVSGIYTLPKESSVSHSQGDRVYWNGTAVTKTVEGNQYIGVVAESAASSATEVDVSINFGSPQVLGSDEISYSKIYTGEYTAVTADDTAGYADIDTGFGEAPDGMIVTVRRAGVGIASDQVITKLSSTNAGKIRVSDGASTYDVTADDVISVIAWMD